MSSSEQVREEIARVIDKALDGDCGYGVGEHLADVLLAEFPVLAGVTDGCRCIPHWQDAGGGYTEFVPEYEPECPEHSEHLYDPRTGEWVLRNQPVTDEMVEAGARAFRESEMVHEDVWYAPWDELTARAQDERRDVARTVLVAAREARTT